MAQVISRRAAAGLGCTILVLVSAAALRGQTPPTPLVTVREDVYVRGDVPQPNVGQTQLPFAPTIPRARQVSGVTNPVPIKRPSPAYTPQAMKNHIEGPIDIEAVVQADGTVGELRIVKSLDRQFGMDEEALKTARQWTFVPARARDGTALPIVVVIGFDLRLNSPLVVAGPAGSKVSVPTKAAAAAIAYPALALATGVQGTVVVEAVTNKDGALVSARVTQSVPELDDAALAAARSWKYSPTLLNDAPTETLVITTFKFSIRK